MSVLQLNNGANMKIGDLVKSKDFAGVEDCYMIGEVVGIYPREGTFRAKLIGRVWSGEPDKKLECDYFTAPLPGQLVFGNDPDRITVLA